MSVDESFETATSFLAYGRRRGQAVVLKLVKHPGDEWRSGEILSAFDGRGVVRVYEHVGGASLLERIEPATPLAQLAVSGRDEEATAILGDVVAAMMPSRSVSDSPTMHDWAKGFQTYLASGDEQIPTNLVLHAEDLYRQLCASQRNPRLLHGDLQHYNILLDDHRGWLAIDAKGVIGEVECEVAPALRNPREPPAFFAESATIERRINQLASRLKLDVERTAKWAFAQAVLSAIWCIEDEIPVTAGNPSLLLAAAMRPML